MSAHNLLLSWYANIKKDYCERRSKMIIFFRIYIEIRIMKKCIWIPYSLHMVHGPASNYSLQAFYPLILVIKYHLKVSCLCSDNNQAKTRQKCSYSQYVAVLDNFCRCLTVLNCKEGSQFLR